MQQGEKGGVGRKRPLELRSFFSWFCDHGDPSADEIAEVSIFFCVEGLKAAIRGIYRYFLKDESVVR